MRYHFLRLFAATLVLAACVAPAEKEARAVADSAAAMAAGNPARAERILRAALAYDPRSTVIVTHLAEVLEDAAEPREAFQLLERLPSEQRQDAEFLLLHARLQARLGRTREAARALAALERAGRADARSVSVLLNQIVQHRTGPQLLAELPPAWRTRLVARLIETGEVEMASVWLATLPDDHPQSGDLVDALLRKALEPGLESALPRLERWIDPADTIYKLLVRRRLLAGREDFRLAAVDELILRRFPRHPARADSLLASAYRALAAGDPATALTRTNEAIALETRNAEAIVGRALALRALGRGDEAREAFALALATDPGNAVAQRALEPRRDAREPIRIEVGVP